MGVLSFLGAMKTGLKFIIERLSKLPTRQELALRALYIITGSVGRPATAWIELFRRVSSKTRCGPLHALLGPPSSNRELASPVSAVRSRLCGFLELLEPYSQSIPIREILTASRRLDHLPDDPLEAEFEKRAIMDFEEPSLRREFGNRGRPRSGGRRRRHGGFWL
jgi:hypothetical protein